MCLYSTGVINAMSYSNSKSKLHLSLASPRTVSLQDPVVLTLNYCAHPISAWPCSLNTYLLIKDNSTQPDEPNHNLLSQPWPVSRSLA